jgi:CheY-like chemotaxis protein
MRHMNLTISTMKRSCVPSPTRSRSSSAAMRRVLRGLLEDAGMQVVTEAADGLEGVTQSDAVQADVVLVDWRMPHLDGIQASARIRQRLPQVQVVMFSSAVGAGSGDLARQVGASAFVARALHPSSSVPPCWPPGSSHPHKPQVTVSA